MLYSKQDNARNDFASQLRLLSVHKVNLYTHTKINFNDIMVYLLHPPVKGIKARWWWLFYFWTQNFSDFVIWFTLYTRNQFRSSSVFGHYKYFFWLYNYSLCHSRKKPLTFLKKRDNTIVLNLFIATQRFSIAICGIIRSCSIVHTRYLFSIRRYVAGVWLKLIYSSINASWTRSIFGVACCWNTHPRAFAANWLTDSVHRILDIGTGGISWQIVIITVQYSWN